MIGLVASLSACKTVQQDNEFMGKAQRPATQHKAKKAAKETLEQYQVRINKMDADQLLSESNEKLKEFRNLMFKMKMAPQYAQKTGEATGNYQSQGLFHSAKGSFEASYGEGVTPQVTQYAGLVINQKEIDGVIKFLSEEAKSSSLTAEVEKAKAAFRKLSMSATSKVDNVAAAYNRVQSLTERIRFVLLTIDNKMSDFEKPKRADLHKNIVYGKSTSVNIVFRTDTDSMSVSCWGIMPLFYQEGLIIHDKSADQSTCIHKDGRYYRSESHIEKSEYIKTLSQRLY